MPPVAFSPLTIKALVDVISGGSFNAPAEPIGVYRTGPQIEALLADCNLSFRVDGSRVPALQEFLRSIAFQDRGHEAIVRVIERVADPRDYLGQPAKAEAVVTYLNAALAVDGLELFHDGGRPRLRTRGSTSAVVDLFVARVEALDFDTVQREVRRALDSAEADPEDAVTAACSLVESVCRSILVALERPIPARMDVDGLLRAVQEPLNLSPGRTDLPANIAADVRQVLSGLTTVAKGIGALRTHAGDAHGRERGHPSIDARIARLAIHAAMTTALFLIETWERMTGRVLPNVRENT